MATKTLPLSVRITQEDSEFIAQLEIEGAVTPSDKIRAMIHEVKERRIGKKNFAGCLTLVEDFLSPVFQQLKVLELEEGKHSEILVIFSEWLIDVVAYVTSMESSSSDQKRKPEDIEKGIVERIFRLFKTIGRMAVTEKAPCYDQDILNKMFPSLLEIITIINQRLANN